MPKILIIVTLCVLAMLLIAGCSEDAGNAAIEDEASGDPGRKYIMAVDCVDILAEYNTMLVAGEEAAVAHVSNVYNLKTNMEPFIAVSDANAKVEACSEASDDAAKSEEASDVGTSKESSEASGDPGREYIMAVDCVDILAEYNAMLVAGEEAAVAHVSNVYNLKTNMEPFIAVSDANAKVEACK